MEQIGLLDGHVATVQVVHDLKVAALAECIPSKIETKQQLHEETKSVHQFIMESGRVHDVLTLSTQAKIKGPEGSPASAYGTPAKEGQGHVSEENDNLDAELEEALEGGGAGAGEGASAPEPSPLSLSQNFITADIKPYRNPHIAATAAKGQCCDQ